MERHPLQPLGVHLLPIQRAGQVVVVGDTRGYELAGLLVAQHVDSLQHCIDHWLACLIEAGCGIVDRLGLGIVLEGKREWKEDAVPEKENKQLTYQ